MTNVLLAHSYFLRFDPKEWKQMRPYPPLGTLYAASVLRQAGYKVLMFDPMFSKSEDEIIPFLESSQPTFTIFFEDNFNYLTKMCLSRMRQACLRMAHFAKQYGSIVIAQGSDPVDHLEEYFSHDVDYVICGEGEKTIIELLHAILNRSAKQLKSDRDLQNIPGIALKLDQEIVVTPKRQVIRDLDTIPFPAWDLVDMNSYRDMWKAKNGYFSLNIVTTRGCPFHCNWCAKPVYGQVYNVRSPENVVREIRLLKENYSIDHIWFCDDIFGLKPGWVNEFSKLIQEEKIVTSFKCQSRVDLLLQENTIPDLKKAGCDTVWVGAESGSQKILDAMEKGTTVEQIYRTTKILKENNIRVAFFLQFGYPGETQHDIDATHQMVKDCKPDDIGISVSYPLPGTKFYDQVKTTFARKQNWITSKDLDLLFTGTFHPDFYRALHIAVHKQFRIKQAVTALRRFHFSKQDVRRIILLGWNIIILMIAKMKMRIARKKIYELTLAQSSI